MSYVLGDHPDRISSLFKRAVALAKLRLSRNTLVVGYQPTDIASWWAFTGFPRSIPFSEPEWSPL